MPTQVTNPLHPLLLDGGMGKELRLRGAPVNDILWSAQALLDDPAAVQAVHQDFIAAGADIITTSNYAVVPSYLRKANLEHRLADLSVLACDLAQRARDNSGKAVTIAGSLPPLSESYRPDQVVDNETLMAGYDTLATLLAPHVDLLLCETLTTVREGRIAAEIACSSPCPVWVAWSLDDSGNGRLRSGETLEAALDAITHLPVQAHLLNCSTPEAITAALATLRSHSRVMIGAYANASAPISPDWQLQGSHNPVRPDLDPDTYATIATGWLATGATIIGGCCGIGPQHIARLRMLIDHG